MKILTYISTVLILLMLMFPLALGTIGVKDDLPNPPPEKSIGQIMFPISDTISIVDGKDTTPLLLSRAQILLFFSKGVFYKSFLELEKDVDLAKEEEAFLSSGHFATKNGEIFEFVFLTKEILIIRDKDHREGYLVLPKKKKCAKAD